MDRALLKEKITAKGYLLNDIQLDNLQRFSELLIEYNQKFNLTAITDYEGIISKHFVDSLQGAEFLKNANQIIDIGSGAGFPSIPLKVFFPEKSFMLLDSLNKRIGFLNTVIEELKLNKIETQHIRIEDAGQSQKYRQTSDVVVARAVAPLNTLVEYALPFLKIGGRLIAYKGEKIYDEIEQAKNAMKKLFCEIKEIKEYKLDDGYSRFILVVEKTKATPNIYPRGNNKPKKQPL